MTSENTLEQRIHTLYAVTVPSELDRRVSVTLMSAPSSRRGVRRPRALAGLAIAAVLVAAAAGPALTMFENWSRPFDKLWAAATPVDVSVTADGYEVTAYRAYADRLGVRVALTVKDLESRWTGFEVEQAVAVDAEGRDFPAFSWSGSGIPVDDTIAKWARFALPAGFEGEIGSLQITVTSLHVRTSEPIVGLDPTEIWTSVGGAWTLDVDVPPITEGTSISPVASASAEGVSISMEELAVVPSGTMVRLAVEGLPPSTEGQDRGWLPDISVERNGRSFDGDSVFEPGILTGSGVLTVEAVPDVDDLAGQWRITVHSFYTFDNETEESHHIEGPWILEFDAPQEP